MFFFYLGKKSNKKGRRESFVRCDVRERVCAVRLCVAREWGQRELPSACSARHELSSLRCGTWRWRSRRGQRERLSLSLCLSLSLFPPAEERTRMQKQKSSSARPKKKKKKGKLHLLTRATRVARFESRAEHPFALCGSLHSTRTFANPSLYTWIFLYSVHRTPRL